MENSEIIEEEWPCVLSLMPDDLEQSALDTEAILRRRVIKDAQTLLRLILAYAWCGLSARQTCLWAKIKGICSLSNVALLERLQYSARWMARLVAQMFERQCSSLDVKLIGRSLRIVDATCLNRAGTCGTDRRLHLSFALGPLRINSVYMTDSSVGESFNNFIVEPGDVMIGDRGYAHREGVWNVVAYGADVIVRLNWQNFPLLCKDGSGFDILAHLRTLEPGEIGDWEVWSAPSGKIGSVKGRLIAVRKAKDAAERERRKVRENAKNKGHTPDARTLEACDYIFIFTTLTREQAAAEEILQLYRFRWQIELVFKRLKSILKLDELPACSEALLNTVLLSRILAALIIDELIAGTGAFSPWGYGLPTSGEHRRSIYSYNAGIESCGDRCG